MTTGFYSDEKCFWHGGGNYAFTLQVEGLVQPMNAGLPENPETKRRLRNLIEVTGLTQDLEMQSAPMASWEDLARVHPESYLTRFKEMSDQGGGELGLRTPFGAGGFEIAALSAGLAKAALCDVMQGKLKNAYALSRPPGHHCTPDWANGFCLLSNIAIAIESAKAQGLGTRFAVIDWDVHHGNGTEAVFYDRDDVLTISLHQDRNYPVDTGDREDRGHGAGLGYNINIPLPPGGGHETYIRAMRDLVLPAVRDFEPDAIIVACGFDACAIDPLSRMLATSETFAGMTRMTMDTAKDVCSDRLVLVHEGGYSEVYVPFAGHAVLQTLSGSLISAPDPMANTFAARQPRSAFQAFLDQEVDALVSYFGSPPGKANA